VGMKYIRKENNKAIIIVFLLFSFVMSKLAL
jgi:hypothetical protein